MRILWQLQRYLKEMTAWRNIQVTRKIHHCMITPILLWMDQVRVQSVKLFYLLISCPLKMAFLCMDYLLLVPSQYYL